jgi:phenylacetate-CoA ligase
MTGSYRDGQDTSRISSIREIGFPVIHQGVTATIVAVLQQLEESQWWSSEKLMSSQMKQISTLVDHAYRTTPFYKDRFSGAGIKPGQALASSDLSRLPPLTRADLQQSGEKILSSQVPRSHGKVFPVTTSGSTGAPVQLSDTSIGSLFWDAFTLRDHLWHQRDFNGSLAAIRWRTDKYGMAPEGVQQQDWGSPVNQVYQSGKGHFLNSASDIGDQVQWLLDVDPDYLISHPSNLAALARRFLQQGKTLANLKQVRTVGEMVDPEIRELCRDAWKVKLVDMYTSQELGYMALQCPGFDHYHVQSEHVYLEVVNDAGNPCKPGEVGRILVTGLHNFATPLIRYEIGDYAEPGEPCACGRGLPVLNRIIGRVRNMLRLPSGEQRWPNFGFGEFQKIADVRQFQVVQHSLEEIEMRVVTPAPFDEVVEQQIKEILIDHLGYPFRISLSYHDELERADNGKFEDFVSLI